MAKKWNLEPFGKWAVLRLPSGEAARLEEIASGAGLVVEIYCPKLFVRRRVASKRKPIMMEIEAYPGYAFARGEVDELRRLPQSRFGFVSLGGDRALISEDEVNGMRSFEARWKDEAFASKEVREVPQFEAGERALLRSDLFASPYVLVSIQQGDSVFVDVIGSSVRIKVSAFLLDRIQA